MGAISRVKVPNAAGSGKRYVMGWVQYFKLAGMKTLLRSIDEWMRHRIRALIWKQWKKIRTKYRNLRKLGIDHKGAYKTANSSKKYWRAVEGVVVKSALTNNRLRRAGYVFFSDYFQKVDA